MNTTGTAEPELTPEELAAMYCALPPEARSDAVWLCKHGEVLGTCVRPECRELVRRLVGTTCSS